MGDIQRLLNIGHGIADIIAERDRLLGVLEQIMNLEYENYAVPTSGEGNFEYGFKVALGLCQNIAEEGMEGG